MPYEVRAKTGESVFSVVVGTAKEALAKIDELLELARVDDVSVKGLVWENHGPGSARS